MKAYTGVKAEPNKSRELLPAGGYTAKVKAATVETTANGDRLLLYFDISEGPFKDFFQKDFDVQTGENKKWRGIYRMFLPKDDGSERDAWSKRTLGNFIWSFETGNPGFHWEWDENKLSGKSIGVLFRNKEWEYNGQTGWTTECCALTDVESIRNGKFRQPKDKPLGIRPTALPQFVDLSETDDIDLPWKV